MIIVTGATGFLGKRVCKLLDTKNISYQKTSLSMGLDLREQKKTVDFFSNFKSAVVLNCASFVGGIQYGYKYPADLFKNNCEIINNLFFACHKAGVKKIINPISNCVYPAKAMLFKEDEIWNGPIHDSVLVYGMVRKASWVASWAYAKQHNLDTINLVMSNMYGPEDHFEEDRSHALGALIMKFVKAKTENAPYVTVWGTGTPVREWLHVDDGAEAMVRAMDAKPTMDFVNVGIGTGISIKDLALKIKNAVGYNGELVFDTTKPDGAYYKTVEGSRGIALLNWKPSRELDAEIVKTVEWYKRHVG